MAKRIPHFESREEEAKFWDETRLDELAADQFEEVEVDRPERGSDEPEEN